MIEVLKLQDENILGFMVEGRIEKADVERVVKALEERANGQGKIKLYAEFKDAAISGISAEALKEDLGFWLKDPGIILRIEKVALVTDTAWVKAALAIECALITTLTGKSFSWDEKEAALAWLRTDQRAQSRLDITLAELAETATLKAAGGFALGLLTASLFSESQRKKIGWAVLLGGIAVGLPLGIRVLNNNRNLLSA